MPLRSIAFMLYFCGSSVGTLVFPMIGIICYIVLYHVYPQTTWWGVPLEPLGIRYSFIIGICLMLGTALNLNRLPFGRKFVHPIEWTMILMLLTMLLSGMIGTSWSSKTDEFLDKMSKVFVFTFLMTHVVVTRRRIWQLLIVFTAVALYLGHEAFIAPAGSFAKNRLDGIGGPDFRESAGLAIHLFALLPFAGVVLRQKSIWLKVLAFFAACYSINAILLCRARSAFLAGMIAGVLAIWYIPHRHRRWLIAVLILAAIGGLLLSDNWFWDRMLTIFSSSEERDRSATSRLIIWRATWDLVKDYPWGVGIGHFEREIERYIPEHYEASDPDAYDEFANKSHDTFVRFTIVEKRLDAHNTYVRCVAETGLHGLAIYVTAITLAWGTLARLNHRVKAKLADSDLFEMLIFANRLALLVYIISGFFVSRFYTEGMWWFIALPVCLCRAAENEIRVEAREKAKIQVYLDELCQNVRKPQLA